MKYFLPPFLKEPERSIDFVGLRKANRAVWTNPLLSVDPFAIAKFESANRRFALLKIQPAQIVKWKFSKILRSDFFVSPYCLPSIFCTGGKYFFDPKIIHPTFASTFGGSSWQRKQQDGDSKSKKWWMEVLEVSRMRNKSWEHVFSVMKKPPIR